MGGTWSRFICRFCSTSTDGQGGQQQPPAGGEVRVGMLGLDNAGKTTILYQLKLQKDVQPAPTVGFNVENIECDAHLLNIWDVSGGNPRTRPLWQHYNQNVRVIIFVVDAADVSRLGEAAAELHRLGWRPELAKAVILIYANKQDMATAISGDELACELQLQVLAQRWSVQECCAINGVGLWEGLQQVVLMLTTNKHNNHKMRHNSSFICR